MFDNIFIASTAISSFNNAALLNPFFFVVALLTVPLLFIVYLYGYDIGTRFGWNNQDAEIKTGFWSAGALVLWMLLFGGNYAVIRDGISLLPLGVGLVLFLSMVVVANGVVRLKYLNQIRSKKIGWILLFVLLLGAITSGMMNWYGILLQISAVICGLIVGCRINRNASWFTLVDLIFGMMTVLILMQPEYFRFGQLGHLTMVHLLGVIVTGFFVVTSLVTKYVKPRGKIRQSAFIKLRWLFRIVTLLATILFFATESVPVFLGLLCSLSLLEMLLVYHSNKIPDTMFKYSWAWVLILSGVLMICPIISALGVMYLTFIPSKMKTTDFLRLL